MPRQQTLVAAMFCACVFVASAKADTCAGHRSFYMGYSHGMPHRASIPFAGTVNPRYANTAHASGPVFASGPTDYLARQNALATQQAMIAQASARTERVEFASDIELMHEPPASDIDEVDGTNQAEEPDGVSPDYPGQFAAAETDTAPPRRQVPRRTASRPRPARPVGQGAFHAAASPELARALGHTF
jgi:hypothetical protein